MYTTTNNQTFTTWADFKRAAHQEFVDMLPSMHTHELEGMLSVFDAGGSSSAAIRTELTSRQERDDRMGEYEDELEYRTNKAAHELGVQPW